MTLPLLGDEFGADLVRDTGSHEQLDIDVACLRWCA